MHDFHKNAHIVIEQAFDRLLHLDLITPMNVLWGSERPYRLTVTGRLCYNPLTLYNHQVVDDHFQQHLHLPNKRVAGSQVAAEVSFEHAHHCFDLGALAVGSAGL